MKASFANKVRKIIQDRFPETITITEIANALDIISKTGKQPLYNALIDLRKAGEIVRVKQGEYKWTGKPVKPQLREVMWRIFRARKRVSIEDLQELSGASELYIKEWLGLLCRRGIARKTKPGIYLMVKDTVIIPDDDKKAERLRKIRRQKKKNALAAMDVLGAAFIKVKKAIEGMEE